MKILPNISKLRQEADKYVASLPALIIEAEKISNDILHGVHNKKANGAGEKFWQFREYRQGDPLKYIDWRQSAKSDTIFVKQKEWQNSQKNYIWCASGQTMNFSSQKKLYTKQATAQIIATCFALLLKEAEEQIGIFGDIKTGNSDEKIQKISDILLKKSNTEDTLPDINKFSFPYKSSIVAIGDFLSPINDIKVSFANLASSNLQNAIIIQIIDPAEIELPYKGRIKFINNTGNLNNDEIIIDNVENIRSEYQKRINSHIRQIKQICQDYNWCYALHKTNDDITKTIKDILLMMGTKRGMAL